MPENFFFDGLGTAEGNKILIFLVPINEGFQYLNNREVPSA